MRETFSGMPSVESDQDDTSTSPLDEMRTTLWIAQCPFRVCAVQRRRFPVGENPTRQSLQPEAIGAVMEVTKWLKPSISVSRIGDSKTDATRSEGPGDWETYQLR